MVTENKVSKQMVKWAASLADESIVLVDGIVQKSPQIIKSASVGDVEVHISHVGVDLSERCNRCSLFLDTSNLGD